MKILFSLVVVLFASAAEAAESPSLVFPTAKIQVPALSLLEAAKPPSVFEPKEIWASFRSASPSFWSQPRLVSKMPILVPGPVTPRAMIKVPDDSIDYKLLIKKPDMESVR